MMRACIHSFPRCFEFRERFLELLSASMSVS